MPVSRPRVARSRRRVGQPPGCATSSEYEPPIRGINEGQPIFLLDGRTVWCTAKILGSCPPHPHKPHLRPCDPAATHSAHAQLQSCRAAAAAPSLSILLGSGCHCSSWPSGVWLESGWARAPSRREREAGRWGQPKLPVNQVSTSTRSPASASRQTKFNHRERPSGNRLESPAYQALVKLSDFLPGWGATAVPTPGWRAL